MVTLLFIPLIALLFYVLTYRLHLPKLFVTISSAAFTYIPWAWLVFIWFNHDLTTDIYFSILGGIISFLSFWWMDGVVGKVVTIKVVKALPAPKNMVFPVKVPLYNKDGWVRQ